MSLLGSLGLGRSCCATVVVSFLDRQWKSKRVFGSMLNSRALFAMVVSSSSAALGLAAGADSELRMTGSV